MKKHDACVFFGGENNSGRDGSGSSLEIRPVDTSPAAAWGDPESWRPSRAIGGIPGLTPRPDFNADGQLNEADIDLLCAALHSNDLRFDLNNDGRGDTDDIVATILSIRER